VGLAPCWLSLAVLVDLFRGRRWILVRCYAFVFWYLACEVGGIALSFLVWLRCVLTRQPRPPYLATNFRLQCLWARLLLAGATRIFGLRFEVDAPEGVGHGPLILFIRHTSIGDTLLPAVYLSASYGLVLRYVLKRELLWDPCLDIVGNRLRNHFARRGSGDSQREVAAIEGLLEGLGPNDGVLIYPEGTRFTPEKQKAAMERLTARVSPNVLAIAAGFEHVLPPRLGGPMALLAGNRGADVVFCAHRGFEGVATFRDLLGGRLVHATVCVRFWRVPYGEIPQGRGAQMEWLFTQWRRMDDWVGRNRSGAAVAG